MLTRHLHTVERPWTTEEAFRYCRQLTRQRYENFPVASLLIPKDKRKYVATIYAFARIADDFADEPGMTPAERIDALQSWEEQLLLCGNGSARHPVFVALAQTIERFEIPLELLQDLLRAFRSDVTTNRHATFHDLVNYCRYSANPVGRLVLLLFNYRSEQLMKLSDSLCTALQLTNFWQDLSVDLQNNRVYLPQEDLERYQYSEEELFRRIWNPTFCRLMAFEVERTEQLFQQAKPLLREVGQDLALELRLTWHGGRRMLRKIEQLKYNVLTRRPTLGWREKAGILLSACRTL
jgi:phytoene synthase